MFFVVRYKFKIFLCLFQINNLMHNSFIIIIIIIIIVVIGIQPLGRSGQRPEFSQATGMALVRCILGKFLGLLAIAFPRF